MIFPLTGNSKIRNAVENFLKEHRLPHAILIDGDSGTGRHTLAEYLSYSAVCSGENVPCEECKNCRLALSKNHPDIITVAPEEGKKNISVDQIRQLKAKAYIKPHQSKKKVFIIDYADTLNEQSQNALLKVLEEPPLDTVFILIAENKASFLETVISRCIVLSLTAPTAEEGKEYISSVYDFDAQDIENALISSRNNIGKALNLLRGKADSKTKAAAKEFFEFALRGDSYGMLCVMSPLEKNRVEAGTFFKDLKLLISEEIRKNPSGIRTKEFFQFYNKVSELEKTLITNINLPLLFADLTAVAKTYIG